MDDPLGLGYGDEIGIRRRGGPPTDRGFITYNGFITVITVMCRWDKHG